MRSQSTARPGETMSERPSPSSRNAYKALRTITTRWMHNDIYGHMNNVVHYSLFDTAVNGWLISDGVLDIHGGDQVGLVVETGCRYFSELAFPDIVTAGIRVAKLGAPPFAMRLACFETRKRPPRPKASSSTSLSIARHVVRGRSTIGADRSVDHCACSGAVPPFGRLTEPS